MDWAEAQKQDEDEIQRTLYEILDRVACGETTVHDAETLSIWLGLKYQPSTAQHCHNPGAEVAGRAEFALLGGRSV